LPLKRTHAAIWRRAIVFAAVGLFAATAPAGTASAASLFEFLFGGRRPAPPPQIVQPTIRALADPYRGTEPREQRAERRPSIAYCVRLCDGRPYPVQNAGISPAQACGSICPASQTKVFAGSSIDHAVSSDGKRYSDLPNALVYRQKLVPGCTCNGKTPGGLASMDVKDDPTLQPGDVVATNAGLVAFAGVKNKTAEFTPIQSYSGLSAATRRKLGEIDIAPATQAHAEVPPAEPPAPPASGGEKKRSQASR
jgi:hypothetical protein